MSFPQYPAYKDSGGEWLWNVPADWGVFKLQDIAKKNRYSFVDGPFGSDLKNEEYTESGVPLIQLNNISDGAHDLNSIKYVSEEKADALARHNAFPGDIVIAKMADPVARAAIVNSSFARYVIVADCIRLSVDEAVASPSFTVYAINSPYFRNHAVGLSSGITRLRINLGALKQIKVALPSLVEQRQIVSFLDRETAKIDALVTEQERLIELLKEKRQALISHAVTKGLDPSVPMKDSGVEWLGEVPANWDVTTIKRIVSTPVTDGPHETPVFLDEGVPFVSAEAVSSGRIDFERIRGFISVEDHRRFSQKYIPQRDDIFMIKSGATTGVSAIVETDLEFNIWSPLAVIRCGPDVLPKYALHFIRSRNFLEGVTLGWSFGTQQNIGMGVIENLSIVVPPLEVQMEIVELLDKYAAQADALISEAEKAIAILQERRKALISAAVTGQIDVRGLASCEAAA